MTTEIRKGFVVGKTLYRRWRHPHSADLWYEAYAVRRVTTKYVFVEPPSDEHQEIRLSRRALERTGMATSSRRLAIFVTEMPEEYRRKTLGYLMDSKPREVLGLPDVFDRGMLRDAYRSRSRQHHPDVGGDRESFVRVQSAYEHLLMTLG